MAFMLCDCDLHTSHDCGGWLGKYEFPTPDCQEGWDGALCETRLKSKDGIFSSGKSQFCCKRPQNDCMMPTQTLQANTHHISLKQL